MDMCRGRSNFITSNIDISFVHKNSNASNTSVVGSVEIKELYILYTYSFKGLKYQLIIVQGNDNSFVGREYTVSIQ